MLGIVARRVKQIEVTAEGKLALAKGYKGGETHCYRQRCQMVLLKLEEYKSKVGTIVAVAR